MLHESSIDALTNTGRVPILGKNESRSTLKHTEQMFITLSTSHAADLLRADTNADWTFRGAFALASYMEETEGDTGEPWAFDAVSLRCEFAEYANATECVLEQMSELEAFELFWDADGLIEEDLAIEWLCERTTVIQIDGYREPLAGESSGGIIVGSF
jgi:hypothetical protein